MSRTLPRSRATQRQVKARKRRMKTVRQFSRVGPCLMLGELVMQTGTRIFYRLRDGKTAWAMKSSELLVHLEPCPSCRDHTNAPFRKPEHQRDDAKLIDEAIKQLDRDHENRRCRPFVPASAEPFVPASADWSPRTRRRMNSRSMPAC